MCKYSSDKLEKIKMAMLDHYKLYCFLYFTSSLSSSIVWSAVVLFVFSSGELLVEQAKCVLVMQHALDNIKEKMAKHCTQLEAHLVKSYPVRSRIQAWVNEKFEEFRVSTISVYVYYVKIASLHIVLSAPCLI